MKRQHWQMQESEGVKQSPAKGSEQEHRGLSAWEAETKMRADMKAVGRECKVQRQEVAVPEDARNP